MASKMISRSGFHARRDALSYVGAPVVKQDTGFTYTFENFFHPFVGELIQKLNRESLRGMLDPDFHQELADRFGEFFAQFYESPPDIRNLVEIVPPRKAIELDYSQPYANYNWELLFHIPLTIAVHLSKNQRFAEAQRWFHYIFDPTSNDMSVKAPERYWKFLAFRNGGDPTRIDELLALLSKPNPDAQEVRQREDLLLGYEAIRNHPFQPHVVARTRLVAYQYWVVMKYLDNLIDWGDHLFRQDTVESLNEATQRYVLAANLLGERPERIPPRGSVRPKTFAELKQQSREGLDPLGNALVELEGQFPFNLSLPLPQDGDAEAATPLFGIGRTLYFCVPHNDKLLGYWDTVADRLFKIRNCLNIEGVFRQLALFDPPLDPGMLVKAAAAGIDIRSIVSGVNQPVGPVRCFFLIQKALELAGEVRGMGSALLSALEKADGERLALLRQGHEIKLQQLAQQVRFLQLQQARETTKGLLLSRNTALQRFKYYRRLLGLADDLNAPAMVTIEDLDKLGWTELTEENFDEAYGTLVEAYGKAIAPQSPATPSIANDTGRGVLGLLGRDGKGKLYLSDSENAELNTHLGLARDGHLAASILEGTAAMVFPIPDARVHGHFWGVGTSAGVGGGSVAGRVLRGLAAAVQLTAAWEQDQAGMAARTASYERRADEWLLQHNLAAHELMQIGRQIIGSLIAEQVAYHEYLSIQKQIEQSQEVETFLHEKFTNAELFTWMQGELMRLYYEYYRFAFDTARKAEVAMKFELMRPEVDATEFVKFNYWDGGRKGLLSGEALYLDVKRLELAYHENNQREFELTKHISLRQLNPLALLGLKATGTCEVTLPEWLFDLDGPGHYLRRIKTVSLSIPAVAGPYTSVNCTLTLLKSSLRKSPSAEDEYRRQGGDDSRFIDYVGAVQSIVTSSGREDGGLFETNLRDERFLPFEGAGAESTWRLELPSEFRQFDYDTISDVVLRVRYTARQGGDPLKQLAVENLQEVVGEADEAGLALLFNLRHDFPNEWSAFVNGANPFSATIRKDYFPYFTQEQQITIAGFELYGQDVTQHHIVGDQSAWADATDDLGDKTKRAFTFSAEEDTVLKREMDEEVFLIIRYSLSG
jgi:hypothetical protein